MKKSILVLLAILLPITVVFPASAVFVQGHTWGSYVTCTPYACIPDIGNGDGNITLSGGIPSVDAIWFEGTGINTQGIACTWQNWTNYHTHDYCTCLEGDCVTGGNNARWTCTVPPDCNVDDVLKIGAYNGGSGDWGNDANHAQWWINGTGTIAPVASFSCTPTNQYPGQNVVCTDTSTNSPTYWKWMYGINGQNEAYWGTATATNPSGQNLTFTETFPQLYTVKLYVNNSEGEDWENKTDYINFNVNATPNNCNLPVASGYIRTAFQCVNSQDSSAVDGCDMQLRDNEGNAWSNATNLPTGGWCIDTYPSHSINAYAQASGYSSATRLNLPVLNQIYGEYAMLLIPGYVPAAPSGSVYLYVTVNDYDTHVGLSGASVEAAWSGGGHAQGVSDSHGVAMLTVKNSTSVYLTAAKTGYVSINKVISTSPAGPDTTMMSLQRGTITATATMTTGPGGTIPVTQGRTDAQSQAAAGSMVLQYMPALVSFFILLIIVGGVKMMGK